MSYEVLATILIAVVFLIGYILIAIEHITKINKATVALLTAVICWSLQFAKEGDNHTQQVQWFGEHLNTIGQIVFFILGALAIVEIMNSHRAFCFLSEYIKVSSKKKFLFLISFITFFMSSVLDNLTTTL